MTADWPDDNPSAHRAAAIYAQAVPLARKATALNSGTPSVAGGGTTNIITGLIVDQPSFQMLIGLRYVPAGATIPFGKLRFEWMDTASGTQVTPDHAVLVAGFAGLNFHHITGPAMGDQLTVALDNLDPATILSCTFGASQTSHLYPRFRLEQVGQTVDPVFTLAGQSNQLGILASINASIGASGTVDRLASAWSGPATLNVDNVGTAASVKIQLLDPGIIAGGSPLYGVGNSGIIFSQVVGTVNPFQFTLDLPAGPVVIRSINTSGAAAIQPTITLVRRQL
jgi:hypothetical protein